MPRLLRRGQRGMTLTEVLFSSVILAVVYVSSMGVVQFHRVESAKAMQKATMIDFVQHYIELARAAGWDHLQGGEPINQLFNGSNGAPAITFPGDSDWHSLLTDDFETFHPDLMSMSGQSPEYQCTITSNVEGGSVRSKTIHLGVRWHPPLSRGANWLTVSVDTLVYTDAY